MDSAPGSLIRSFLLNLRVDGPAAMVRRIWTRLFGREQRYIFVRYPEEPRTSVEFPVEINGVLVRDLQESDLRDTLVRRSQLRHLPLPAEAVVAVRDGRIVGATWYMSSVTPKQPWYHAIEPHVIFPARATANLFVVPGDRGAAWAMAKAGTDRLAKAGVRTIVGVIASHNKRSILMCRLLGGRMVAQMSVRHYFGYSTTVVEALSMDQHNAITTSSKPVQRRER